MEEGKCDKRALPPLGINSNVLYQDNKSTILLEKNGKKSSGPHTRALNIRYFFLTDQVEKGNVMINVLLDGNTTLSRIKEPMCILLYMETMCIYL
jgi:hypothetical protein